MTKHLIIAIALCAVPFLSLSGLPDSVFVKKELVISRLTQPVVFDGLADEAAWKDVAPFSLVMHSPVFGKAPSESTEVRLAYDEKYLYIGAALGYNDPGMMRSVSLKRDFMGMGSDWFGIILDTFNDKENGVAFFTTPDGLRFDADIQRDAYVYMPDQQPMNISWNTFWDVRTKKDKGGWSVEMRIPVSSLRFREENGQVKMGLIVQRWIPSANEMDIFPAIPPNWGQSSSLKPSQANSIVFNGIRPGKPIYIAPYILPGFEIKNELNAGETEYLRTDKPKFEAGLDIKYGLTKDLVIDLTANTDFAQVEADDQQINLSRFSLFFPEKRMFFLERASVFDFSLGGNSNLFYSRRIGLSDDGDPVRIYGGARIMGKIKKWDVGFLDMQTAPLRLHEKASEERQELPSENFGVIRFRRQIINENSYVGTMMTSRLGADGSYNLAYGIDGLIKVFGDDYFNIRWVQTFEDSVRNSAVKDPTFFMVNWERRAEKGIAYGVSLSQSGENFNPGIGFEMMNDYRTIRGSLSYGWIPGESSKLYSHSPETRTMYRTYVDDGSLMSLTNFTGWNFVFKNQTQAGLTIVYNYENLRDSLEISEDEVFIVPGRYRYLSFMGEFATPMSKPFYNIFSLEAGRYFDGKRFSVRFQPTWNISCHLELGGTYSLDRVKFTGRELGMTNHIAGIKVLYMLNTRLSANMFLQYNTAFHGIIANFRIRYNPKEGNDLYLVFNEDRNTDLNRQVPKYPSYNSRAAMIKYTYTFSL